MDAQELPEALIAQTAGSRIGQSKTHCPCLTERLPALCHPDCALRVIDLLLSIPNAVDGQEMDLLLDLRFLLRQRKDAEAALRVFCELRRRLEHRHYLVFYRLRRWCERHIRAEIRLNSGSAPAVAPLRLDFYCVEAVRRASLCAAAARCVFSQRPALSFEFVPVDPSAWCGV